MKLIMLVKKDSLFQLDPYVRQIAFTVFANNPFKCLKVEFGRIQIQKLLNKATPNFPMPTRSEIRQLVVMIMGKFPDEDPANILHFSPDEIQEIFADVDVPLCKVISWITSFQVFYSPSEYFNVCDNLANCFEMGDVVQTDNTDSNLQGNSRCKFYSLGPSRVEK